MASTPTFFGTPILASGLVPATADASLTAPTHVTSLVTGAAAPGTQITEVVLTGVGTTVNGRVNIFTYDGSTYHLYDQIMVTAITPSTTQEVWRWTTRYDNLILPSASWSLVVTVMDAGNQSLVKVTVHGANG